MTRRTEKVSSLMQHEVGEYLTRLELPAMTTISKVDVTPDLKWCKVWVTIFGEKPKQDEVMEVLGQQAHDLQTELNHKLKMKFVPRISFVQDVGEEYASRINELLREANE